MAMLLPLSAFSQDHLTSLPVGFVRVGVPSGTQTLVSTPFVPFDDSIDAVLSGQLTGSTNENRADKVFKWDTGRSEYVSAVKAGGTGDPSIDGKWFANLASLTPSGMTIEPGEGFYVLNNSGDNESLILCGEVVLAATNEMRLAPAFNLIGYPFSSSAHLRDTAFPPGAECADVLELGKGYWCKVAGDSGIFWTEPRPYADAFPSDDGPPQITGMSVIDGGSAVRLMIQCDGTPGGRLDIFYKDMSATNRFDALTGWQIAVSNWDVTAPTELVWEDRGGAGRSAINETVARYYLLASATIDKDGNGIPDARERFVYEAASIKSAAGETSSGTLVAHDKVAQVGMVANQGASSATRTFHVDAGKGDDKYNGFAQFVSGFDGPKKTINGCLTMARPGDTVYIHDGLYREAVDLSGRGLQVLIYGNVTIVSP